MMLTLAAILVVLAAVPTVMTIVNVRALSVPAPAPVGARVAILIPARDEEAGIEACVRSALASCGVALEVVVLDDQSTDATAAIVMRLAKTDSRLRLAAAPPLPPGWSGKQHACHVLASLTEAPNLLFIDADVRLAPEAAGRLAGALGAVDLVSGVPQQRMGSLAELLIIPMINMLLLGYLPIPLSRRDLRPALAAACGQLIAVRATAYAHAGGHAGIRTSWHDGLMLPRLFRAEGFRTDLVAASDLASCRMYADWRTVVRGTLKNATEGLAKPIGLPIWTAVLLGGHVFPWAMLIAAVIVGEPVTIGLAALACVGPLAARSMQAVQCREPLITVPLNPISVVLLLALQWWALGRKGLGKPESWRGRSYPASS